MFFLPDYNCADLHQWLQKGLISPPPLGNKLCPLVQHSQTIISLLDDKEYTDKWRLTADNGFSIESVGNRPVEGGTVFWQTTPDSSGCRRPLSSSLLRFPPPHHSARPYHAGHSQ